MEGMLRNRNKERDGRRKNERKSTDLVPMARDDKKIDEKYQKEKNKR